MIVRAVRSYFRRDWDLESLVNVINHNRPITHEILHHLEQMYRILFWILASFWFGFHFGLAGNIGRVGLSLFVVWYPWFGPLEQEKRFYVLIIGAMLGGSLVGPSFRSFFVAYLGFSINVILGALMAIFAALVEWEAARFNFLSLSDVLLLENPVRVGLVFAAGLFLSAKPNIETGNLILCFVAYTAVFSRTLVERIRYGDDDFVNHAITFFTDAPAVCIHLVDLVFWGALDYLRDMKWEDFVD